MPTYVEVAVNMPRVSGVFHYHLPPALEGNIEVGHLLVVPFGQRIAQGVVLEFVDHPSVSETRAVLGLVDADISLTPLQITFARQLARTTLASLASCIGLFLPPGLGQQADMLYHVVKRAIPAGSKSLSVMQSRLLSLLRERGPLRGRQIDHALPRRNWRAAARSLIRRGLLTTEAVLTSPSVRAKAVRTIRLAVPPERVESALPALGRKGSAAQERRQRLMRFLLHEHGPVDVSWAYAESGANSADLRRLAKLGLLALGESEVWRDPLSEVTAVPVNPPELTRQQQVCWDKLRLNLNAAFAGDVVQPILLHGVTGSGKTEIYLRAVDATIRAGKQAIVLVPEIALTPQTVNRFLSRFPGRVGLIHSRLSPGERYDTWRRARQGDLGVVIGPRSALFTPLPDLGLLVVDESHDSSYYQSEPPFYHAREAAVQLAQLAKAVCLLGSATPSVRSTFRAAQGRWQYLKLPARIIGHKDIVRAQVEKWGLHSQYRPLEGYAETIDLPVVTVVDMRQELKQGNRSIFSLELQQKLKYVLDRGQQAILFLNRRGTATYVFCRDCGFTLKCPRCDLPLTYHDSQSALLCHHCGYRRKMPAKCPQCSGQRIRQYGMGTEKVEREILDNFPQARTLRWDYSTTRKKGAHKVILRQFAAQKANVLVGTQMLAKGLDLPLVTLVGVVLADVGLGLPDYTASERTFQLLTQVAGRAGRSPLGGEVILQTFQPEHYVIRAASTHDYRAFYQRELAHRRELGYPPFARLVRLEYRHRDNQRAEAAANRMAEQVQVWIRSGGYRATELIGPVPCFFSRVGGIYRWQIVLRGPDPARIFHGRQIPDWRIEINPPSLL